MKIVGIIIAGAAALALASGCVSGADGQGPDSSEDDLVKGSDDYADLDIESGKAIAKPTAKGVLTLANAPNAKFVAGTSGYHLYTFRGSKGNKVSFEASADVNNQAKLFLRITSPSGKRFVPAQGEAKAGFDPKLQIPINFCKQLMSSLSICEEQVVLPETGVYQVLVSTLVNMTAARHGQPPTSAGGYSVNARADIKCNADTDCGSDQRCLRVSGASKMGQCMDADECMTTADCAGVAVPSGCKKALSCELYDSVNYGACDCQ